MSYNKVILKKIRLFDTLELNIDVKKEAMEMIKNDIEKIVTRFLNNESIAFDLIQHYGESFETELINLADKAVSESLDHDISKEKKGLVAVALTMIAIRYYDGNMWDHIRNAFQLTYDGDLNQRADAKIRSILQLFKKDCNYSNPESLIAVPLVAAGVTHYWLPPFFDFCFAIYKENLLARRDIEETELQSELQNTFESMRLNNHLSETEDVIHISGSRSYKLSKYTQSALLTGTNTEGLASIGAYCVRSIIRCLNNENHKITPYYEEAFEKWKDNFYLNKEEKAKLADSGNWKIAVKYVNGGFYLITKTEKVSETNDPNLIKIQILENGKPVEEIDDIEVRYGIGGYIVASKQIKLNCDILNKPSYRIICGEDVLYDCEDRIYKNREVFFFDDHGELINSGSDYTGNLICVTREQPANYLSSIKMGNLFVSNVDIVPSGDYIFDEKHYAFKTIRKPGLEGIKCSGAKIKPAIDNEYYDIYNSVSSILVETRLEKDQLYLAIDKKELDISSVETVDYPILDNGVRQFKILLPQMGSGMHLVSVNSLENKKPLPKCSFIFVLDSSFKKSCEQQHDDVYLLKVNSTFVNDSKEVTAGTISVDFKCFVLGRGIAKLTVFPEIISVSMDRTHWLTDNSRLSAKRINVGYPVLYVTGPDNLSVTATSNNRTMTLSLNKTKDNENIYELNIGPVLTLDSLDVQKARITLQNEANRFDLYIDFVTYIDLAHSSFEYRRNIDTHFFKIAYIKEKEIKCEVVDMNTKRVCYSCQVEPNTQFSPTGLKAFVTYKIVLTEKGSGLFAKDKTVAEIPYYFTNLKELVGHVFEVCALEFYGNNTDSLIRRDIGRNGTTLKFLGVNRDDPSTWVGTLKRMGEYHIDELKSLGLLKLSTEAEFEGDKLWVYITDIKDDEQLLFDNLNKKIYKTNDISNDERAKKMPGIERYLIKHI